jgi:hypothetical protein
VALQDVAHSLCELLGTEAAIRRVDLAVTVEGPVQVMADPRFLSRDIFRGLLRALERAQPGERVEVRVLREDDCGVVRIPGAEPIAYPGPNA